MVGFKRSRSLFPIILFLCYLFGTSIANATIHYVRQGATGNGNGTDWNDAYTDLPNSLIRGDTYYIAGGSYTGQVFNTPPNGTTLITVKKAIASDHGTNTGWSASYGTTQAVFNSQLDFQSSYWLVDGQTGGGPGAWNTNFGFKVVEKNPSSAVIRIGTTASESRYTGVTVRHVDIQGIGGSGSAGGSASNDGVAIYGGSDFTLSYAWFHALGRCPVFGYSQGVNLFEYVYVSEYGLFGPNGVHSEVASLGQNSLGNFTWRYNLVTTVKSTGGIMWNSVAQPKNQSAHLYIYGNVFYKPASGNWDTGNNGLIGGWTNYAMNNVWIYNNSFINIPYNPISDISGSGTGNLVYNNLFYNSAAPHYGSVFPKHDYNTYINSGGTQSELHGISIPNGDPFINFIGLDFRLKAPIGEGMVLSSPPYNIVDPMGIMRGTDNNWDSGAFEFNSSPNSPPTSPISPPNNLRII